MKICKDGKHCSWRPACRFLHPGNIVPGPAPSRDYCNYPARNRDNYTAPGRNNYPTTSRNNYPTPHRDNYPAPSRDNYPAPSRDNYPAPSRDNYPAPSRDNYPAPGRDNYNPPAPCRNGRNCSWRPKCRFYHPEDQSQAWRPLAGKQREQQPRPAKKDDSKERVEERRAKKDDRVEEEQATNCYQDGHCTGEQMVVRTRNPGGYWFKGGMEGCLPEGRGVMEYDEGLYQGEWRRGDRHGLGRAEYWDEEEYVSQYLGDWEEGKWDGEGVTVLRNGKVYDGIFKHNCRSGRGKLTMISGSSVEGDWRRCRLVGEATVTIADEDAEEVLGTGTIMLEGFEEEKWFADCEETELYDNFLENVVEDVSSMILTGCKHTGPFVISNKGDKEHEASVAQMKQMMENFRIK
eukprot:GFUD01002711.1.p1 GENE.GFUD01002711.1~~GFUD01002711.1.p1  ORF type:complete len:404 (-),score=91.25 GFUD01002711.1:72-1283(-)